MYYSFWYMEDKLLGRTQYSNTQNYLAFTEVSFQFILGRPRKLLFNYILIEPCGTLLSKSRK